MSIFEIAHKPRVSADAEQAKAAAPEAGAEAGPAAPGSNLLPPFMPPFVPAGAASRAAPAAGVVPPPAAPVYSMRPPEAAPRGEGDAERAAAESAKRARAAQRAERVRVAMQRAQAALSAAQAVQGPAQQPTRPLPRAAAQPRHQFDPVAATQAGLLNLAWRWQEAGAPIRAIHAYMQILTRYPDTPGAAAAVADLVALSERLAEQGQFQTALAIYDQLEHLL